MTRQLEEPGVQDRSARAQQQRHLVVLLEERLVCLHHLECHELEALLLKAPAAQGKEECASARW